MKKESELKNKNQAVKEENKIQLRELEDFYVNGTIENLMPKLEELKEQKVNEMLSYVQQNQVPIRNKEGDIIDYFTEIKPVVINNYFFKSICPLKNKIPIYNAEKLGILFEYYQDLIAEVNDKIGTFPPSLTSFCRLCGITTNTLREYKNSNDIEMRNVVEKIYDQLGDENLTLSQMGRVKEKSTIFKLEAQHDITKKNQPNVNITFRETISKEQINSNLEKYHALLNKKGNEK